MIRIRFHGRGGQGIKTAGRIVGTAAFLAGFQVQDSPIYGAERRGASVAAFTRISSRPIQERGIITSPDLVILADETLLADVSAGVLSGMEHAAALFINAPSPEPFPERFAIKTRIVAFDLAPHLHAGTLSRGGALSSGLAAAAVKLTGIIPKEHLLKAMREELGPIMHSEATLQEHLRLAETIFDELPALDFSRERAEGTKETPAPQLAAHGQLPVIEKPTSTIVSPVYAGAIAGAPSIIHVGNAAARNTGAWRVERPEIDRELCTRCGLCFLQCPDGAILKDPEGYPIIDNEHCKGCMICRHVCPLHAISGRKEVRSWTDAS